MITILCKDSRSLPEIPDGSVHLTITSPPYNCGKDYHTYNDNQSQEKWEEMLYDVFEECSRVMTRGARIAVNTVWALGRQPYIPVYPIILEILNNFFELLGTVVWKKSGTPGSCAFGSFRSPASPCLRDHTESIIIAKKPGKLDIPESALVRENGKLVSPWLSSERFLELTRDYWEVAPTNPKASKHPAAWPVELPKRIIELYGYPGCKVLDPFAGSGNTGKAAKLLGCDAILCDIDVAYCELMKAKLLDQEEMF